MAQLNSKESGKKTLMQAKFVREMIDTGIVEFQYLSTNKQLADCMTKPLTGVRLEELKVVLGLREISFV